MLAGLGPRQIKHDIVFFTWTRDLKSLMRLVRRSTGTGHITHSQLKYQSTYAAYDNDIHHIITQGGSPRKGAIIIHQSGRPCCLLCITPCQPLFILSSI